MTKQKLIICPHCGCEYHPSEIFLPNYILGKPQEIQRDSFGKILLYGGIDQDLKEEFICENCDTAFKVTARLDFVVEEDKYKSFSEDYSTTIYKDRIKLKD